jgi:hypothetical protein
MRSADEIKKGLECCSVGIYENICTDCPYSSLAMAECPSKLKTDALALIQQLEADKQQLEGMLTHMNQLRDAAAGRALKMEERVHQLEAERDAAVEEMHGHCSSCKDYDKDPKEEPCVSCYSGYGNMDNWQWRGVQKEDGNA